VGTNNGGKKFLISFGDHEKLQCFCLNCFLEWNIWIMHCRYQFCISISISIYYIRHRYIHGLTL
jgi:hypothetical protein